MKSAGDQKKETGSFASDLIMTLAFNLIVALIVTLVFVYSTGGSRRLVTSFITSMIVSNCIGLMVLLLLTLFNRSIEARPFPYNWVLRIGCLVIATVVGFLIGGAIMMAAGLMPREFYWSAFRYGIWLSLVITLVIGIGLYVYDSLRSRLEATTSELRERELAEERARKLAIQAQLSSLESRIHPHFLFNTLNSISSLIQEDPRQAERIIERLAALLRFSLESSQTSTVPLAQEMKIVGDYLEIEKARFGDRLRYSINVPAELERAAVPPLAVQTVVENSVKHSISKRREGGEITISASASNRQVIIEVSDDGPGFSVEEMTLGHGLDNLQSRLRALFDKHAGLSVSNGGGRAVVTIRIPQAQAQPIATL